MGIDNPPVQSPGQGTIHIPPTVNPYSPNWWISQTISGIDGGTKEWLLAQGWTITGTTYDNSTTPPTPYHSMARESTQNQQILLSLINSYTVAANDAKAVNEFRYNQIVTNWSALTDTSQDYFDEQVDEQNEHVLFYLGKLDDYMSEVDDLIEENQSKLVTDTAVATTALTELNARLVDLETNATANAALISGPTGLLSDQAGYVSTFMEDFAGKLAELDENYSAHLLLVKTLLSDADTDMDAFILSQSAELTDLSLAHAAHVIVIDALLLTASTNLTNIAEDINNVLTAIDEDYTDVDTKISNLINSGTTAFHAFELGLGNYGSVLALLQEDYDTHALAAPGFLDGLGTTELARINEQFAASLATQLQQLTDNGLYSAVDITDITARNTRDRNEEIASLNDRLAREKLDNQHKLYGQQTDMRARTLDSKDRIHTVQQEILRYQASQVTGLHQLLQSVRDRTMGGKQAIYALRDANTKLNIDIQSSLYGLAQALKREAIAEAARLQQLQQSITQWQTGQRDTLLQQIQQIETQHLTGIDKQNAAQQEVSKVAMSERDQLLGQLQDAVKGFISGKERYSAMTMQNASALSESRHRVIVEKMNEFTARQEGFRSTHADNMKLMAYQLDERNRLLIGLYGFVERREDIGPKFEELSKVVTALGDSGGAWITP